MKTLISLAAFFILVANDYSGTARQTIPAINKYTYAVFQNQDQTYGYAVLNKGKKIIQQSAIPGRPGNKGFTKKADAEKVAKLVVSKLEKGIMPPTVSEQELKKLNL